MRENICISQQALKWRLATKRFDYGTYQERTRKRLLR